MDNVYVIVTLMDVEAVVSGADKALRAFKDWVGGPLTFRDDEVLRRAETGGCRQADVLLKRMAVL